jgi:hypothetical protein
MHQHMNPKAARKAMQAASLLAKAASLMREAAGLSDGSIASGKYDFIHWANQIEEILSCDNGEAGIGPAMQRMTREGQ